MSNRRLPPWSWAGASAFVLAILVGGGWATALIMSASARTPPISDNTGNLLTAIGGVLAGTIATYVGSAVGERRARRQAEEDERDEERER